MKRRARAISLMAIGGMLALPAFAQADTESGLFLGGGAIYTRVDNELYSSPDFPSNDEEFDDDRVSWKALAGFRFNPVLSLEAQYLDFGDAESNGARAEADGWTAAAVADLPLGPVTPYAKAGALFWNTDAYVRGPLNSTARASDDGTDFFWGLGAHIPLGEVADLRLEYERFELEGDNLETRVDAASLNLQFNFGQ